MLTGVYVVSGSCHLELAPIESDSKMAANGNIEKSVNKLDLKP